MKLLVQDLRQCHIKFKSGIIDNVFVVEMKCTQEDFNYFRDKYI